MQPDFFESVDAQASVKAKPPESWARLAITQMFGGRKAALDRLSPAERDQVIEGAWCYSCSRRTSLANPLLAAKAHAALLGQHNSGDDLAAAISLLSRNLVTFSDIPPPPDGNIPPP